MAPILTALWLGLLTAMGPCTMTTNLLAVVYIARRWDRPLSVLFCGLWFAAGTIAGYTGLGALVVAGSFSMPAAAHFLQKYMNELLGPILILAGIFMLGLIEWRPRSDVSTIAERLANRGDALGAALLGAVFALTFCPVSAALFFGSLIPLSLKTHSSIALPALYGLGTGVPVIGLTLVVAASAGATAGVMKRVSKVEVWARRVTGVAFIGVGIHLCLAYVFELY